MENKVLATVAGEEITEAEFEAFLQNVPREQQAYLSNPATHCANDIFPESVLGLRL